MILNGTTAADHFDLIGIGVGPANLSLSALSVGLDSLRLRFLEQKARMTWHPSLLFNGATMQTSYLEDLVTPVDPTNPFSFLAFLADSGRMYQFLCANPERISRLEFESYLQWAAAQMRNIEFGSTVHDVGIAYDMLQIKTADRKYSSRMISIGIGTEPVMPEWLTTPRQQNVFLAEEILARSLQLAGKRVAVVGGGQTAAEVVLYLINSQLGEYAQLDWISRRQNFLPLDDTPFVNEFFTPQYVRRFHRYADIAKEQILRDQKIYADGITRDTLHALYAALYHDAHVRGNNGRVRLFPSQEVVGSTSGRGSTCLMARDVITHHKAIFEADIVIVCTGYRQKFPKFLEGLRARFEARSDGQLQLDENFKLVWDKPVGVEIFVQNGGRHTHGVADPQLCLAAWRSATILNAALGYEKYRVKPHSTFIRWSAEQEAAQDNASSIMVGDIVAEGDLSTEAIVSLKSKKAPLTPAFERTLRRVGEQ